MLHDSKRSASRLVRSQQQGRAVLRERYVASLLAGRLDSLKQSRGLSSRMPVSVWIDFQGAFEGVRAAHCACLRANRRLWLLLSRRVVHFSAVASALEGMDGAEEKAERVYRAALERFPRSPVLLRALGRFVETLKMDPWGAQRYAAAADRCAEEAEAEAAQTAAAARSRRASWTS